jgi:hypothetical protein
MWMLLYQIGVHILHSVLITNSAQILAGGIQKDMHEKEI